MPPIEPESMQYFTSHASNTLAFFAFQFDSIYGCFAINFLRIEYFR